MTPRTRFATTLALTAGLAAAIAADARAQVACGDTIGKGQTVTLTADVGPCDDNSNDALIVVDSGVLDLGGRTVTCDDANTDGELPLGIVLTGKKAQVRNGTVVGCRSNVFFGGSGKHRLENVTARAAVRYGFYISDNSPKNQLIANVADANGDDGFQIQSDKNKIEGNTSQNGEDDGFDVTDASKNKFTGNTATGNSNSGIEATGSKNKIVANTSTGNGSYGIGVGAKKNKVIGNTATGNGISDIFGTEPCGQNKFKDNIFGTGASCV
ncbi:MAG: NosD domain-containing protein, partial [Candidatus Rokuibacteriota bacterium]